MAYIKFKDSQTIAQGSVSMETGNIATLKFKDSVILNTSGFEVYLDKEMSNKIGVYTGFGTIYRNDDETKKYNGYQLSNDGSVYVKPIYTTKFVAEKGGELFGDAEQKSENYNELTVPTPIPNENYKFVEWVPEIPTDGNIASNNTFTAIFSYVETQEDVLNDKISELKIACEEAICAGVEVRGERYTYAPDERTELIELYNTVYASGLPIGYQNAENVCREYQADEIIEIYVAQKTNHYSQTTYRNQAISYLTSLETSDENKELISNYVYGTDLIGKYLEHYNEMMALYKNQILSVMPSMAHLVAW